MKEKKRANAFDLIVVDRADPKMCEGYYRLKDNVLFLNEGGKNKVIQLASSVTGERKTQVAANLAVLLGMNDKKVIVVDLNFIHPGLHRLFGFSNTMGLSEYMNGKATLDEAINKTSYKNVDVLLQGENVANSSLVLISEKFRATVEELGRRYDVVLLDMSPVLQSSDYLHVSPLADATIFLVAYGKTKRSHVQEAIGELRRSGANIVGSVFTLYDAKKGRSVGYVGNSYYDGYDDIKL